MQPNYHLSSIIYHLSSIIYHLSSIIYHLSSIIYHLSSIIYHLSSIIYHLSSIIYHLSSIIYHLSSIIYHLSSNKLSLDIDKTNYIIFHSLSVNLPHVKRVKFVKFLGLLVDENLSWKFHLSELSKKLARTYGMFFKIRNLLPLDVLICLYNDLFLSFLQ